jgi:hypothetical protein
MLKEYTKIPKEYTKIPKEYSKIPKEYTLRIFQRIFLEYSLNIIFTKYHNSFKGCNLTLGG